MDEKETASLVEQVAGITECPICSEKLTNNRLLPCGHTFCLRCLELYKKKANPRGKSLSCPLCRKEFGIPKGGCSSLAKNFAMEQLIDVQKPAKDNDLVLCDVCDHDRQMTAILFCLQCDQNLCADCERTHKKMRSTSTHHVLPISKKDHLKGSGDINYCKEHTDHRLELVCSDCNEPICWKCKSIKHHSHNCVEINEIADQYVEQLKLNFEETDNRILMLGKISANIKDKQTQQQESFETEKNNIARISADMIRTIVANEEKLLKQLETDATRNMKALQPQGERVNKQLEDLKQHKTSIKQLLDCGQPWEIYRCTVALHEKTVDLLKFDLIDTEESLVSKLSDLQIRSHLIGNKPALQDKGNKQPPQIPLKQPTMPSTVTKTHSSSNLKSETSATVCGLEEGKTNCSGNDKKKIQAAPMNLPSVSLTDLSHHVDDPVEAADYYNVGGLAPSLYYNQSQPTPQGQTNQKKQITGTSLSASLNSSLYVNLRDDPKIPPPVASIRSTPTISSTHANEATDISKTMLHDSFKRERVSDWSSSSVVGKITGDCKAIIGVTTLKQSVYVIQEKFPQIQVYDSNTLKWLSEFKLEDLHEPKHLASCAVNNCLYLAGLKDQTVYKVEGNGSKVLLKLKTDGDSHSISTTKDGNIILIGFLTQTLKEYTTHGTLVRTIILKSGVSMDINPWHALKLDSGNYLICYGKSRASKHRVCLMSPDGDILKSFGDERGSGTNGLFGPYHLALDEKGNILVADCNNHRIVILSPNLQYVTEIKTDLRYPVRLCIDSGTGKLYVADNAVQDGTRKDGQIVVFKRTT